MELGWKPLFKVSRSMALRWTTQVNNVFKHILQIRTSEEYKSDLQKICSKPTTSCDYFSNCICIAKQFPDKTG